VTQNISKLCEPWVLSPPHRRPTNRPRPDFGAMTLVTARPLGTSSRYLQLALELGSRAALAVDNSRLFSEREQASHDEGSEASLTTVSMPPASRAS